jgi:hypothetical protein
MFGQVVGSASDLIGQDRATPRKFFVSFFQKGNTSFFRRCVSLYADWYHFPIA